MKTVMAGNVLTLSLLLRISKQAYQFGGLKMDGERKTQWVNGKLTYIIPTVYLPKEFIKGSPEIFMRDFKKTMNAQHYNLELT